MWFDESFQRLKAAVCALEAVRNWNLSNLTALDLVVYVAVSMADVVDIQASTARAAVVAPATVHSKQHPAVDSRQDILCDLGKSADFPGSRQEGHMEGNPSGECFEPRCWLGLFYGDAKRCCSRG